MPKKPQSLKEQPLKKKPIGLEKSPLEEAIDVFGKRFVDADKKSGFDLYRLFRDSIVDVFSNNESATTFNKATKSLPDTCLQKLNIFEKEYIENLVLSITLKTDSPNSYPALVHIVDHHVKPNKQRQGASLFKEGMAGFLVFMISGKGQASIRQAEYIASQIFSLNFSYVEASYKTVKNLKLNKDKIIQDDVTGLFVLYAAIKFLEKNFLSLSPLQSGNKGSEKAFNKALSSFNGLSQNVISNHSKKVKSFIKKHPQGALAEFIKEKGIDLSNMESSHTNALYVLGSVFFMNFVPQLCSEPYSAQ